MMTFNPLLKTREEVEGFLKGCSPGTGHSFLKTILLWDGQAIQEIDISALPASYFLSNVSLGNIEGTIDQYLNKYTQLASVKDYTIQFLSPGEIVTIQNDPSQLSSFVVTNKVGTYFDYVAYMKDQNTLTTLTYSSRNVGGLVHSGDIGGLLHTMSIPNAPNTKFLLGAIGYQKTPLVNFVNQVPVVFLVKHSTQTIYMVPCPLDEATIRKATLSGLVVGKVENNVITYVVLTVPVTVDGVNTGDLSTPTSEAVDEAFKQAEIILSTRVNQNQVKPTTESATPQPTVQQVVKTSESEYLKVIQFVEDSLDPAHFLAQVPTNLFVGFGTGLTFTTSFKVEPPAPVNLPCIFGNCENVSALALSTQPKGTCPASNLNTWHDILNHTKVIIVHCSPTNWLDTVVTSCLYSANAIFVVHANVASKADVEDKTKLEEVLNSVGTNSLTLAGPNSIVLVEILGELYFYRGVRWAGLLDKIPEFAGNMTNWFSTISAWVEKAHTPLWPTVVPKSVGLVYWKGEMKQIESIINVISEMGLLEIRENEDDIVDFLTQVTVILDPENIAKAIPIIDGALIKLIDNETKEIRSEMRKEMQIHNEKNIPEGTKEFEEEEARFNEVLAKLSYQLKTTQTKAKKKISKVSHMIATMVSVKGTSSRHQDLKRRLRRAAILSNVEKANSLTQEEKCAIVSKYCSKWGVLLCNVDASLLPNALDQVGKKAFFSWLRDEPNALSLGSLHSQKTLDGFTLGLLLTSSDKNNCLQGTDSSLVLSTVKDKASIPLCLCDSHIELKDPSTVNWPEESNKEMVAMFRILIRGAFCNADIAKPYKIDPGSMDIGILLAHLILCTMENFTQHVVGLPQPQDRGTPLCQIMRGLYGQLLTVLASGTTPISFTYQYVMRKPTGMKVPEPEEWSMFLRMIKMFPYTGWSMRHLLDNLKTFIVRYVRRTLTDPVTLPLKEAVNIFKKESANEKKSLMNESLVWTSVAANFIHDMLKNKELLHYGNAKNVPDEARKSLPAKSLLIIKRLLDTEASSPCACGSGKVFVKYFKLLVQGTVCGISDHVLLTLVNVITRRSAIFKDVKKGILDALVANDMGKYEEHLNTLNAICNQLTTGLDIPKMKIQNKKGIFNKDINSMKSDAEIKRTPWSIIGDNTEKIEALKKTIFGDLEIIVPTNIAPNQVKEPAKEEKQIQLKQNELIEMFGEIPKSDKVISVIKQLENASSITNYIKSKIPLVEFQKFLSFCGVSESQEETVEMIAQMIERYFKEWKKDAMEVEESLKKEMKVKQTIAEPTRKLLQVEEEDSDNDFSYFDFENPNKN
uniref:Uncharacterized protein n=1 Tax=Arcella intermedia TaxID=1963864 RepID=A0A6B2KWR9_9EUKA